MGVKMRTPSDVVAPAGRGDSPRPRPTGLVRGAQAAGCAAIDRLDAISNLREPWRTFARSWFLARTRTPSSSASPWQPPLSLQACTACHARTSTAMPRPPALHAHAGRRLKYDEYYYALHGAVGTRVNIKCNSCLHAQDASVFHKCPTVRCVLFNPVR